jgi:1-acyl-sn-glycerol-3-phosphate acyltransferase
MKSLISFVTLLFIKVLCRIFYRYEIGWPKEDPVRWKDVHLIVFLNHTSLFEVLYLGFLPVSFLRMLSKRMVAPGADKTLNRPLVGFIFKLFSPGMTPITRKRDDSWQQFLESIYEDSIIVIAPEGRMMRRNGLDLEGNKMTVRQGVVDVLAGIRGGQLIFAYSGGLHHVQVPGEGLPKLFKTLKMDIEVVEVDAYKASFEGEIGSRDWRKRVAEDMQQRLETKPPRIKS